ncbi:13153_t:CDS:1, partial [Ambispora gerdemannii]
ITKLEQGEKEKRISTVNSNNIPDAPLSDISDNASNSDIYQES